MLVILQTAVALEYLQKTLSIPVIGVIEPGARTAMTTRNQNVLVLGTEGTIKSEAYRTHIKRITTCRGTWRCLSRFCATCRTNEI